MNKLSFVLFIFDLIFLIFTCLICVSSLSQVVDDQCTHFNSIDQLKDRPTHLLVFMQHVILQFDPAPLVRTTASVMQHTGCTSARFISYKYKWTVSILINTAVQMGTYIVYVIKIVHVRACACFCTTKTKPNLNIV